MSLTFFSRRVWGVHFGLGHSSDTLHSEHPQEKMHEAHSKTLTFRTGQ